jgi:hypothetical protein
MQLIASDLLSEARGLSYALCGIGIVLGLFLWSLGCRLHRFWIAAGFTAAAGVYGLQAGRGAGTLMLAAGVLAAVSAGMLALEMARVISFAAAGVATWMAVHAVLPKAQEPLLCFLVGGLFGVILFRLWLMALSSLLGVLLSWHCALLLLERLWKFDAAGWAARNPTALTIAVAVATAAGVAWQGWLEAWVDGGGRRRKEKALATLSTEERDQLRKFKPKKGWWGRLMHHKKKAA